MRGSDEGSSDAVFVSAAPGAEAFFEEDEEEEPVDVLDLDLDLDLGPVVVIVVVAVVTASTFIDEGSTTSTVCTRPAFCFPARTVSSLRGRPRFLGGDSSGTFLGLPLGRGCDPAGVAAAAASNGLAAWNRRRDAQFALWARRRRSLAAGEAETRRREQDIRKEYSKPALCL
jgi:hypothetical protein